MSKIALSGNLSGTGTFTIASPNSNSDRTVNLPDAGGDMVLTTATQTLTNKTIQSSTIQGGALTLATAVTASGTSVDFTGIPAWVKRITVMLSGVSTNGTSIPQIQLGTSAGVTTTGYTSHAAAINGGTGQAAATSGHISTNGISAAAVISGNFVFTNISGNSWVGSGTALYTTGSGAMAMSASTIGLASALDRVRITTVNGTDTFDAGTINIMYEG